MNLELLEKANVKLITLHNDLKFESYKRIICIDHKNNKDYVILTTFLCVRYDRILAFIANNLTNKQITEININNVIILNVKQDITTKDLTHFNKFLNAVYENFIDTFYLYNKDIDKIICEIYTKKDLEDCLCNININIDEHWNKNFVIHTIKGDINIKYCSDWKLLNYVIKINKA